MPHVLRCLDVFIWHNDLLNAVMNVATLHGWPYDSFEFGLQSSLNLIVLGTKRAPKYPDILGEKINEVTVGRYTAKQIKNRNASAIRNNAQNFFKIARIHRILDHIELQAKSSEIGRPIL